MLKIRDLRTSHKLLALVAAPMMAVIYLSFAGLQSRFAMMDEAKRLRSSTGLSVLAGALVHELQKERGMTAGYLGSKGRKFKEELQGQRKQTDIHWKEMESFLSNTETEVIYESFMRQIEYGRKAFQGIQSTRRRVDALEIPATKAIGYYTEMNGKFLGAMQSLAILVSSPEIKDLANAYGSFVQGKERAGIERAVLSKVFAADKFTSAEFVKFINLVAEQRTYMNVFLASASPEAKSSFEAKSGSSPFAEVSRLREIAKAKVETGNFGVDPVAWFRIATERINLLKQMEDELAESVSQATEAKYASAKKAVWAFGALALAILGISGLLFRSISRSITQPLGAVVGAMEKLSAEFTGISDLAQNIARGNLTVRLDMSEIEPITYKAKDELGELSEAARLTLESRQALVSSFKNMISSLRDMVDKLNQSSSGLSAASGQLSAGAEEISAGAQRQSSQIAEISTAVEEMTATAIETAKNASETSNVAQVAQEKATRGSDVVSETVSGIQRIASVVHESSTAIERLAESATRIGEITNVIDDIADQTNLLALNAAIEAARAGEQGRGFAVVADEVRKLAERTSHATGEIAEMVGGIQSDTSAAVEAMNSGAKEVEHGRTMADQAGESLVEILTQNQHMMDMIQQIASAAEQQSAATEQISKNIDTISHVAAQAARGSEEAATASEDVNKQAEGLTAIVGRFTV